MDRWLGKVALVTGASSGIGASIATELTKYNIKVVGFARRLDRLKELQNTIEKKELFIPRQGDITKEQDIIDVFKWIKTNLDGVDILINNAGVLRQSNLTEGNSDDWKHVFDVNVMGLCIATREAVKSMIERNIDGYIININSLSGHRIPLYTAHTTNVYPASKYAVTALTETLRLELHEKKKKIKTTSISPGLVKTEIADAGNSNSIVRERLHNMRVLDPIDVANAVIYVLSTPPHALVTEIMIRPIEQE